MVFFFDLVTSSLIRGIQMGEISKLGWLIGGFIDSVFNSKGSSRPEKEEKSLGYVYIPYVKGVSEKFKRIGNRYNIKTIFRTKHTLRHSLMKTRQKLHWRNRQTVCRAAP
jgi:hypothetical protein